MHLTSYLFLINQNIRKKTFTICMKNQSCKIFQMKLLHLMCCSMKSKTIEADIEVADNSTSSNGKHIEITSESYRNDRISDAIVSEVYPLSSSVKGYKLKVLDTDFKFLAGQWVDTFIPDMKTVGGFSISSSPLLLKEEGYITLGIKRSSWAPAKWFYDTCQPGHKVSIRVGGDFFYPQNENEESDLLLVAGGVGVNPIFSIFSHYFDSRKLGGKSGKKTQNKVSLLFSASYYDELLYKPSIDEMAKSFPESINVQYFTTKEKYSGNRILSSRISLEHIKEALSNLNQSETKVYICGPPTMIESINNFSLECGVPKSRIFFEKWW
ncbi:UNVERIFIED_CONTAM: hypothetical protein RMT77_009536 [Armadillidium vulgare]